MNREIFAPLSLLKKGIPEMKFIHSKAGLLTSRKREEENTWTSLYFDPYVPSLRIENYDEMKMSEEEAKDLKDSLEELSRQLQSRYRNGTLDSLRSLVKIHPSYIEYKDPKTGMQIVASINGLSYLVTPCGVTVQLMPDSFKVKDVDGKTRTMPVPDNPTYSREFKQQLKELSDIVTEEVKDWISGDIGLL